MQSKIIHIDMDAFYASIEQRDRPELRGRPVVVGHPRSERAVVAAASYEARRFGIHSAMPMVRAWRQCPDLCVVRPDFAKYRAVSAKLRAILSDYSETIEPLALDECYLDVSRDLRGLGSATWTAQEILARVRDELGLTASAGAAPVKFVAKIASDHHKPDGLCVVPPERVLAFISPLPVERLWGVGPATAEKLHRMGLRRVSDLAACDVERLTRAFGQKGERLHAFARGQDDRVIVASRERKSRGAERTFQRSLTRPEQVVEVAIAQLEHVCEQLHRASESARCVTLKVRYDDFTTVTRSRSLARHEARAEAFVGYIEGLVARTEADERGVRLVGVSLSGFEHEERAPQLSLFGG